jgi:hypothetical protein
LLSVTLDPAHTTVKPVIAVGIGVTSIMIVIWQPESVVYVIIVVPADTPVTTPDVTSTVAIAALPLLHVPPVVVLLSVDVAPAQIFVIPVIGAANGLTVTTAVERHPNGSI